MAANLQVQHLLNEQQLHSLKTATQTLSAEQLIWASGYLAGLAQIRPTEVSASADTAAAASTSAVITVLYGSQTGNGEKLAKQLHASLAAQGLTAQLVNMRDYRAAQLKNERFLFIVVST
ncbi:MAG: flavodoxin domain-containing protein, partial [Gammaproteobacteria bacterium]|nr:flavodoxin domain-containing protein [Gammaproteobacteria bacterium]